MSGNYIANPQVGDKVVRGPGWRYESQDEGSVYGKITEIKASGWTEVQWIDSRGEVLRSNVYRCDQHHIIYYDGVDARYMSTKFAGMVIKTGRTKWVEVVEKAIKETHMNDIILSNKIRIKEQDVLQALADPDICENWKERIEVEFPWAKEKQKEYFNFGDTYTLSFSPLEPIFIGHGLVPNEKGKCLLVDEAEWEVEVTPYKNESRGDKNYKKIVLIRKNK